MFPMLRAEKPESVILVKEEKRDVGKKDIGRGKNVAVTYQVAELYVGDNVIASGGIIHLVDLLELNQTGDIVSS